MPLLLSLSTLQPLSKSLPPLAWAPQQSQWLLGSHSYLPKMCFPRSSRNVWKGKSDSISISCPLTLDVASRWHPRSWNRWSLALWHQLNSLSSSFNKLWCVFPTAGSQMPNTVCLTYSRCSINMCWFSLLSNDYICAYICFTYTYITLL